MADLERIYVVPLRGAYLTPRVRRSRKAVKILQGFISQHMKVEIENIWISQGINSLIWKRGIQKPPRKIKVRVVKNGDTARVMLMDEKIEDVVKPKEKKAEKKEEKKEDVKTPKEAPKPVKEDAPKAAPKEEAVEKPVPEKKEAEGTKPETPQKEAETPPKNE